MKNRDRNGRKSDLQQYTQARPNSDCMICHFNVPNLSTVVGCDYNKHIEHKFVFYFTVQYFTFTALLLVKIFQTKQMKS